MAVFLATALIAWTLAIQFQVQIRAWETAFAKGVSTYYSTPTVHSKVATYPKSAVILAKDRKDLHLKAARLIREGKTGSSSSS